MWAKKLWVQRDTVMTVAKKTQGREKADTETQRKKERKKERRERERWLLHYYIINEEKRG